MQTKLKTEITLILSALLLITCSGSDSDKKGDGAPSIILDSTNYTYTLTQSSDALPLWTTPCTHKVKTNERGPAETRNGLNMSAARNEFEPVQLILGPVSGKAAVTVDLFENLGNGQRITLAVAGYEQGISEYLNPTLQGATISLSSDSSVPVWITVYVPKDAPAGKHITTAHITKEGTTVDVPITLTVFDFNIPDEIHFASQLNINISNLIPEGGSMNDAKNILFEHRFTPKSVTWPSGFNWKITWENKDSTDVCEVLWDEPDESNQYSIGWLSKRYILGEDWNGVGFPNAMLFQFVDNDTPRPGKFCGISRGDHLGTSEYNMEWSQFLSKLQKYLSDNGLLEKAYYYVQNEPQDDADLDLAAYLCELTKQAAPNLRIAVSEEPKPKIAQNSAHPCGYDIWIAHIRAYQQNYAWERQRDHAEEVWLYSLDHDPAPYFNPTTVKGQGINQRIIPWVSWTLRTTGWAYYDAGRFFKGANPTIRAELLREGFEDYEYLYLANDRDGGGTYPKVFEVAPADTTVATVASSLTSWTKNPDALMALRHELGRYIEGTRDDLPTLQIKAAGHPRSKYYINFQDPSGAPTTSPLVVNANTYIKIGWDAYNDNDMYGWYGEHIGTDIVKFGYDNVDSYNEAERSYIYDDFGRDNLFEFALENGAYKVTVGAGRPGKAYPNDPHHVTIEGVKIIDDEPTSNETLTFKREAIIKIIDGSLSVEMGGHSQSTDKWSYTFLQYLQIEPI